jgi:SAM-dependent methyltransferase
MAKKIELNDYFSASNRWSNRILGLESFHKTRDIDQIEREYNQDKYLRLLQSDASDLNSYRKLELEQAGLYKGTGTIVYSLGDELFEEQVDVAREKYYDLIRTNVNKHNPRLVCELGCGYGYNLSLFGNDVETYGGEYSENAVKIANKVGLNVQNFNYYHSSDYDFIKPGSTIFTSHSIEQIPDAGVIIENLRARKHLIDRVIHIEPTFVKERTSLLGLMRNRYIELNDYNRNLAEVLKNAADVELIEVSYDVYGFVPLNSSNLIIWRFKD